MRMKAVQTGLLHVRRVNGADVSCIQQFVIHRDEHPQAILQFIFVNDTVPGGCEGAEKG